MNDKIDPELNHQTDEHEEFDPLAELARIVAGESENADNNQQPDIATQEETLIDADDMEAELMRELQQIQSNEDDKTSNAAGEQSENLEALVESINELDASLDNADHGLRSEQNLEDDMAGFVVPAAPLQPVSDTSDEPQESDAGDFQNDLIDALQLELDDTSSDEQEPSEPETETNLDTAALDEVEVISLEEEMASIADGSEANQQTLSETDGIGLDEDLGKAFLNEFESRVGNTNAATVSKSEPEFTEFENDEQIDSTVAEENSDLEIDFEKAFSNELGLSAVDDDELETYAPEAVIADHDQPEHPEFEDEINIDPGHSGEIPDAAPYQPVEKTGGVKYAVAAIVIALMAGAGVAVYGFVGDGKSVMLSEVPLIEAIKSPYKTKPENPGGKIVDNQDNATYAEVEGVENQNSGQTDLVSNTEEPAIIDQSALDSKDTDRLSNTEQGESAGATQNAVVKPRVVKIQTVKPDGTIVGSSPSSSMPTKVEEQLKIASNQAQQLATEVKTVATKVIEPLKPLDGAKTTNEIIAPTASPKEKPVVEVKKVEVKKVVAVPQKKPAKPVATQVATATQTTTQAPADNQPTVLPSVQPTTTQVAAPSAPSSSWVVQVSSSPSQQEAESSYNRLVNKYSVIQGRSKNIQTAQVNGRTYYRLRLNTASKADAAGLCSKLKASGGDCFITQ